MEDNHMNALHQLMAYNRVSVTGCQLPFPAPATFHCSIHWHKSMQTALVDEAVAAKLELLLVILLWLGS